MGINNDVERLGDGYQRIVAHLSEGAGGDFGGGDSGGSATDSAKDDKISELKSIVAKLRKEKQQLQDELEASIKSIDSISKEYSKIYSDAPNKEGTAHLEEELSKLKAKIGVHLDDDDGMDSESNELPETESVESAGLPVDGADDVPDMDIERSEELKELREKTGLEGDDDNNK